jgi:hypothetical protein
MYDAVRTIWCALFAAFVLASGGCSALVRSNVDTQPLVSYDESTFETPATIVHGTPVTYTKSDLESHSCADLDADLVAWAPIIVQGIQSDGARARYDRRADAIGSPVLEAGGSSVGVDVDAPALFARVEHARVRGHELKQLVYVFWYPERPIGTLENGSVDGGILRITLDVNGRPGVFEYSQPCGCFHGVFVAENVEASAHTEFGDIQPDRRYAVEPAITGNEDWVVRDLVEVAPGTRPTLYLSAGKHFCEAIRFERPDRNSLQMTHQVDYELRPYGSLSEVPTEGGGSGSIFRPDGLVIGGKRWKEELVLSDLNHPGWPRHLDQMLIHWDHDRWNDETLLVRHLRLPSSLTIASDTREPSRASVEDTRADDALSAETPADLRLALSAHHTEPQLLIFTNRYCLGCRAVKNKVLPNPLVQLELAHWDCRVIDTADAEGAALAARHHVSVTPVVVGFSRDGQEVFRSEEIDTPEKLLDVLEHGSV